MVEKLNIHNLPRDTVISETQNFRDRKTARKERDNVFFFVIEVI